MSLNVSISAEWFLQTDRAQLPTSGPGAPLLNGNLAVKLYPQWYKQISVEWSVPAEFGQCLFDVYFAQTEDGPFEKLNATPIDGTFLMDTTSNEYSKFDKGWYVVEAILVDKGNAKLRSAPQTWETAQRNWVTIRSNEIQRREYWLLSKFVGVKSYLFRKKSYGKRCPACWNAETEQVMDDHCPVCIGTSFEGGFFAPAPLFLQYETTPNERVKTYFGKMEANQIGAWTVSLPVVNSEDVIVRIGDWNMYRVDKIMTTELQANTVRQLFTLTQLAKGDVEYQLIKRQLPDFPQEYII
jgi:hypothetical protein